MAIIKRILTGFVITGNIFFILWILYNGINEGFMGTMPEIISYITLMALLSVNTFLLLTRKK